MAKEEKKKELKDTTKSHQNSKAPAINYPKGEDISPIALRERYKIRVPLDQEERLKKADKLCQLLEEWQKLDDEKKAAASDFAEKLKAKETEIDEVSEQVRKKYEEKDVICDIVRDFGKGVREYHYKGVKYHEEKLKASDHQLDLLDAEKKNKRDDVKKDVIPLIPYKKGDWIETVKGVIIELTEDDLLTLNVNRIKGYASEDQISDAIAKRKKK